MHAGCQHRALDQGGGQIKQPFEDIADAMTSLVSSTGIWHDGGHHSVVDTVVGMLMIMVMMSDSTFFSDL